MIVVFSLGAIMLFDYFFSPMQYYFNNLSVLIVTIVAMLTAIVILLRRARLKGYFSRKISLSNINNTLLPKILSFGLLFGYVYSLSLIHWNYTVLRLDRFPTVPIYAWTNIMGIGGFLTLCFLGGVISRKFSLTSGEKYSVILLALTFVSSVMLDYNNVNQVIKFFDPNLISFRLIPIFAIPVSYLAGSQLHRLSETINYRANPTHDNFPKKVAVSTLLIMTILAFIFSSFIPRIRFWMNTNWPSSDFEKYQISEEELRLVRYLANHITEKEIIALEDGSIKGLARFGEASPFGRIVALSGANVISKRLGYILFMARSIETVNLLKETLNIEHIVVKKSLSKQVEAPSYLKDILLENQNIVFETDKYVVYNFPSLNVSEAMIIPDIDYPFHYGIFPKTVTLSGEIKLKANLLAIEKLEVNNSTLTNVKVAGNITLTLFDAEGNLTPSLMPANYYLRFDGFDDYVRVPNVITSRPFTVQFWARLRSPQRSVIFESRSKAFVSGGKEFTIVDSKGDGKYQVGLGDGSHFMWSDRVIDLSDLEWHNVAVSVDDKNMIIYVDGAVKQRLDVSKITGSLFNVDDIEIGRGLAGYFNGEIGDFIIYNGTCTQKEIKFIMMSASEPTGKDKILAYIMEKETGTVLHDSSGNENDGMIYGCSWHLNGMEVRLLKPAYIQLKGRLKTLHSDGTVETIVASCINLTKISTNLVLPSNSYMIEVHGNISLKDCCLTWPYVWRIGLPGDIMLKGNVKFEVLNIHDLYIPMRLMAFTGLESYYQDPNYVYLDKFFTRHESISTYTQELKDIYISLALFLVFSLGYILVIKIACSKGERKNGR